MRKVFAALALIVAGCPAPSPSSPAIADVSTPAAYCDALGRTYAMRAEGCVGATAASADASLAPSMTAECTTWSAPVAAGKAVYHANVARSCLDAMATLPCDMLEDRYVAQCDGVLTGTVTPGGTCASNDECLAGQCDITSGCTGTCVEELAAGASCSAQPWMCGSGATCDYTTWTCVPIAPAALGAACGPGSEPCVSGAYCASGTCVAKLGAGGDCSADSDACGPGTSCHQDLLMSTVVGMCVPWVRAGEACGTWTGRCVPGTHCDASLRCAVDVPNGGACAVTDDCLSGWCDAGTCTAPRQLGETCVTAEDRACVWGAYCEPITRQCAPWNTCR